MNKNEMNLTDKQLIERAIQFRGNKSPLPDINDCRVLDVLGVKLIRLANNKLSSFPLEIVSVYKDEMTFLNEKEFQLMKSEIDSFFSRGRGYFIDSESQLLS